LTNVLLVCHANTCRSVMAHVLLEKMLAARGTNGAVRVRSGGIANHARATACLILHATASGSGVHIAASALPEDSTPPRNPIPWNTAQTASLPQSLRLANELGLALDHARLPVLLTRASIPPLDNLTCPAVAIELAPLAIPGSDPTPVTDATYQQHAAEAIVTALTSFRSHTIPQAGAPR